MRTLSYILLFFLGFIGKTWSQNEEPKLACGQYYFHKGDVVFEFDKRVYAAVALGADKSADLDFSDLNLLEAAQKGDFSAWTKEGWKLKQLDENRFQLRKPVKNFEDKMTWDLRFVLNQAQPVKNGKSKPSQGTLGVVEIENPNAPKVHENPNGNRLFRLEGHSAAHKVILSGNFNNWDEHELEMRAVNNGWELRLDLKPGLYDYKFIVDGNWMEDPANPDKTVNQHGTYNSVCKVQKSVKFVLKGFQNAQKVVLAGSFNDWNPTTLLLHKTAQGWETEINLTGGKHEYKYVVDGEWVLDPGNPRTETTWDGYINSIILVR